MLSYADIKPGSLIELDGEPYEVLQTSGVVKKQRQKPHNTAKMRNMKTGAVVGRTFSQSDKVAEADIETREIRYIYARGDKVVCAEPNDPSKRFSLPVDVVGDKLPYLCENDIVEAREFDEEIIDITIPVKVELEVVEAPPNIKGNTSAGGDKVVVLETGLKVTTPLFIEVGDTIRVNTQTGAYVERA